MDIADWLRSRGLERYETAFRENDVCSEVLCDLTAEDLERLGVATIGHRRRLLVAIAKLRDDAASLRPVRSTTDDHLASISAAERRPLSVMFCDLIGSTALSSRLDPEDLREIIRTYQASVAATIQQFDGFIARYVGDGLLIYFGWPEARETDAERAVRAGLAVAAAVSAAPVAGEPLQVRIGIATGLVVIGEPIGAGDSRQQTAVGETPNLAARLQGLAGPNQVVIDAATRRQIGGLFQCQDLGTVELKGLTVAVPSWQVLSENRTLGQFEALRRVLPEVEACARETFVSKRNTVKHNRGTDIFEAGNIRFGLEMRRQRNGDGGLAVHVLGDVGGSKGKSYVEETELLAFDCFWNGAHYHYGPRNKNHRINWDMTIIDDPLEWTFEQIENRKLGAMIVRAGYPGIAADLDLDKIASVLPALKKRAFEMYEEGERLTGHKGLPLEFTPNLAAE